MNAYHKAPAGSPIHTRLPKVDEEPESLSGSEYSDAASGEGYAYDDLDEELLESSPESVYGDNTSGRKENEADYGDFKVEDTPARAPKVEKSKESRSWTDLEWSIIVALLSPVGNWLTGSDHVKNLFLLLLLIFYLHQLIEGQSASFFSSNRFYKYAVVPWKLYRNSRPRRRRRDLAQVVQDTRAEFALSELRAQEIFYLICTVVSPFIGAVLVRHVFAAMGGVNNLSWFSTTLFILATGIRPWTHLISRLQERSDDLQQALHHEEDEEHDREVDRKLASVMERLAVLETALKEVQAKAEKISPLQEICDDISEALETVERTVSRQERKTESARVSHNNRLTAVETVIFRLEERQKNQFRVVSAHIHTRSGAVILSLPPFLSRLFLRLHNTFTRIKHAIMTRYPFSSKTLHAKDIHHLSSPTTSPPPMSPSSSFQFFNGTPLETIPEAADSDSEGTYVADHSSDNRKPGSRNLNRNRSKSEGGQRLVRRKTYGRRALDYTSTVVSWPYRAAVNILLFLIPSQIQKFFA